MMKIGLVKRFMVHQCRSGIAVAHLPHAVMLKLICESKLSKMLDLDGGFHPEFLRET
jgi:hypothetical protein